MVFHSADKVITSFIPNDFTDSKFTEWIPRSLAINRIEHLRYIIKIEKYDNGKLY